MPVSSGVDWNAASTIVTAIGVLTALALGVWANWLQYRQVRLKDEQEKVLVKAWGGALQSDVANTLVRAKKLQIKLLGVEGEGDFRQLHEFCREIKFIDTSYVDSFVQRLDIFPLPISQSLAVFHVEVKRLQFVGERIENGGSVHLSDGSGAISVLKSSLETIIGWGELAMRGLYSSSGICEPPDVDEIARESVKRDLVKKGNGSEG